MSFKSWYLDPQWQTLNKNFMEWMYNNKATFEYETVEVRLP